LVTALELARHGHDVVVLESGKLHAELSLQNLATADIADSSRHAPMAIAVQRRLGGTSGIWGGRCVPLDLIDFAKRPHIAGPGWPIPRESISIRYGRACEYLLAGAAQFSLPAGLARHAEAIVPGFSDGDVLGSTLERWCLPTDLGREYRRKLQDSRSIRVHLGLTCTELALTPRADAVQHAVVRNLHGGQAIVRARRFVVATGGIEAVRLLQNSGPASAGGLGNHGGWLGIGYMGHVSGKIADVHFNTDPDQTISGFERDTDGVYCRRRFTIADNIQMQEGLQNCALWLDNPPPADARHRSGILSAAYLALSTPPFAGALAPVAIRSAMIENPHRSSRVHHVMNMLKDLPATASFVPAFLWRRYVGRRRLPGFFLHNRANQYALHYHAEQARNTASRITLSAHRDAVGMLRARVDLRYCGADYRSVRRSHEILDRHLRQLGVGRLEYRTREVEESIAAQARDGFHQIGGTAMSAQPGDGVVDVECRVHGLANLYVASSSVFPTSGQANPTLTIVALAIRLAGHLHQHLAMAEVRTA
jgi:choline dehydrogenase-like flavoprotein